MGNNKDDKPKKTINQRQKGARAEREFAHLLRDYGYEAERGVQRSGGKDSPDVKTNMHGVHWEIKRTERLRLHDALNQSKRDAGENEMAVVGYRRNHDEWIVIQPFKDWIRLYQSYEKEQTNGKDQSKDDSRDDR